MPRPHPRATAYQRQVTTVSGPDKAAEDNGSRGKVTVEESTGEDGLRGGLLSSRRRRGGAPNALGGCVVG